MSLTTQAVFSRLRLRQLALVIALDKQRSLRMAAAGNAAPLLAAS